MTEQTPKQKLTTAMANLKLTIDATFVPWSKSRNAKPNPKTTDRSLNWKITLKCNGRDVLTTNYSAGIGHCPSYRNIQGPMPIDKSEAIIWETERGQARRLGGGVRDGKPILPDACDVMYSLISDADVIDHPPDRRFDRPRSRVGPLGREDGRDTSADSCEPSCQSELVRTSPRCIWP